MTAKKAAETEPAEAARPEPATGNIYQRMAAVMMELDYIRKDREVKAGKETYRAVSHDYVVSKARPVMLKHGVIALPRDYEVTDQPDRETKYGNKMYRVRLTCMVRFQNINDRDDFVDVPSFANGEDSQDKAPGKAISMAIKYALLKGLMLETGDREEERVESEPVNDDRREPNAEPTGKRKYRLYEDEGPEWWDEPTIPLYETTDEHGIVRANYKRWCEWYREAAHAALKMPEPATALASLDQCNKRVEQRYMKEGEEAGKNWLIQSKAKWMGLAMQAPMDDGDPIPEAAE